MDVRVVFCNEPIKMILSLARGYFKGRPIYKEPGSGKRISADQQIEANPR